MSNEELDAILYENLDYGAYIMDYPHNPELTENVRYHKAEFNKLNIRRIRLPDGRGNIIFLLTDTFENSLKLSMSKNFVILPTYRKFFYPWIAFGAFMRRRYKMNLTKLRAERVRMIKDQTKYMPHPTRQLQATTMNTFFSCADLYQQVVPIIKRYPIKKVFTEFFKEFDNMIMNLTPKPQKEMDDGEWNNRIMIIDADSFAFKPGSPLSDNITNPLFLLYLAYLRTRNLTTFGVDRDMLISSKNMFLKFNPAQMTPDKWGKFRIALFKIMNANLDNYTNALSDEEKEELELSSNDNLVDNIIDNTIEPFTKNVSSSTKGVVKDAIGSSIRRQTLGNQAIIRLNQQEKEEVAKEIRQGKKPSVLFTDVIDEPSSIVNTNPYGPVSQKKIDLFNAIIQDQRPLTTDEGELKEADKKLIKDHEEDIKDDVVEIMNDTDILEEVDEEIQEKIAPIKNMKNPPVNSARDLKLREAQRKIVVGNSTIEQILERDSSNVPIQTDNKSDVLTTSNQNMHDITFANFDKTYIEELYTKDLVACFDMLKDKSSPFYITDIKIEDTSTSMDLKETWTVKFTDENKKRHSLKINIPKFYQNRFMLIGGNKYIILKQNFYNPLVKDTPDTVILTTNYFKVTIRRKSTKSLADVERIFSLIRKTGDTTVFTSGDASKDNMTKILLNSKYISSLEYDELSRRIFKFETKSCKIYFSRDYLTDWLSDEGSKYNTKSVKGNEFIIGHEGDNPIIINEDTGRDRTGRNICEIIKDNLPEELSAVWQTVSTPKQPMFAEGTLAGQEMPIIATLIVWVGLTSTLDKMGIKWTFHQDMKRMPKPEEVSNTSNWIKFADGYLEYENQIFAELILNGLNKLHPSKLPFKAFDTSESYDNYVYSVWGTYDGVNQLRNFHEFLIDPITKEVCRDLQYPTESPELLIHAVKILSDNDYKSKAYDGSYRVRSVEVIPAILYKCISEQYLKYVKAGHIEGMTLPQNIVIDRLQAEKMVDEYSTLNPAIEVGKAHTISTKGYRGSNSEYSYDENKRSYDPSSVGKIAISTSNDANVGINRELVIEPTLTNARGYRQRVDDIETLKDVNIFSPVELLTPGTTRNEDPMRTAMANKQSQHLVPVENADPALVSNGYDEALQFHLSNDFVINAEEDGKVVEINLEIGFIVVQYKSGKHQAININPEVVKNSGGGFYMANQMKPAVTKLGQKFKKDEVLAYHDKYFKYSSTNGLRYAIGPLTKMAFMSTYNTYEDAGICTSNLADKMKTKIVYMEDATFKRNANILQMVKIGDTVNIGDTLIRYDTSHEDSEISKYITRLSEEDNVSTMEEMRKNDINTSHAGTVIDIQVYSLDHPDNLSPSLGKIVKQYFKKGIDRKKLLEKYDKTPGIIKAGYMLRDNTSPIITRYNNIRQYKGIDVLIEIYIENFDVMGVGDKIALYSANKQIISEVIPEGYEPYSEFRPDEEISVITSPGTIARRMTPSVIAVSAAMKCMIELKRKIKEDIKYSK